MSWQNFFATKLFSDVSDVATTITLETAPTVTAGRLVLEARNTGQREIIKYTGVVGNQITGVSRGQEGTTARSHLAGTVVEMNLTAQDIIDAMNVPNDIITRANEIFFDHVADGCVLAGVSYGASLNYTMSLGVVYINGTRVPVSAIASTALAASKDNYIDVAINGTVTVTAVTNNAASPALAANSVRLGIIVTGASSIANVGSVNQGQEGKVLPIASSVAYSVTDSLGNLICPRDPNRKLLGYKQSITPQNFTLNSPIQCTGLSVPVLVPNKSRKVRISTNVQGFFNTPGRGITAIIWDGAISGTQLMLRQKYYANAGVDDTTGEITVETTLTPGLHTINLSLTVDGGAGTFAAGANPLFPFALKVDLV